jgi:general secretion pathway protein J
MLEESNKFSFQTGFTLIEILMAMFILGLIMTTIFTSYTGSLRNINAAEDTMENYQKARSAFERIIEDLESAYIFSDSSDSMSDEEDLTFMGFIGRDTEINGKTGVYLRFVSEAHVSFEPDTGPRRTTITYYVEESDNGESLILLRADAPKFKITHEGEKGFILCDNLHLVNFVYQDINGEIHDNWNSTDETMNKGRMPVMVSIILEFRCKDGLEHTDKFSTSIALPMAKDDFNEAS